MQIGANFIVTPSLREDIAIVCNRRKTLWMPGCGTLSEIGRAEELGSDIVKLFPGDSYGPKFIKAIKDPSPWTDIMPTGGVVPTKESIESWFRAGVICVGMGSNLIIKDDKGIFDFEKTKSLTQLSIQIIKDIKVSLS